MKRLLLIIIALCLFISLVSCNRVDIIEFERDGVTYYYEYSHGIKTVTNYHPYKFFTWGLPDYQEMVQYGNDVGLENDGVVYFIYVVDTSIDPDDPKAYYIAELDGETKELLCEDGEYFSSEEEKNGTVMRLVDIIDTIYFK